MGPQSKSAGVIALTIPAQAALEKPMNAQLAPSSYFWTSLT
jgi:hypothetical protein